MKLWPPTTSIELMRSHEDDERQALAHLKEAAMDTLDADRLVELYADRDVATTPQTKIRGLSAPGAYWQGRIDEYAAQNAITPEQLAACEERAEREANGG